MVATTTKPRHKFLFSDRLTAEKRYHEKSIETTRNYHAMMAYKHNKHKHTLTVGCYTADVITHYATTNRELSMCPIVVLLDTSCNASPEVMDAYDWSVQHKDRPINFNDQDQYDYRQLAENVYQFCQSCYK